MRKLHLSNFTADDVPVHNVKKMVTDTVFSFSEKQFSMTTKLLFAAAGVTQILMKANLPSSNRDSTIVKMMTAACFWLAGSRKYFWLGWKKVECANILEIFHQTHPAVLTVKCFQAHRPFYHPGSLIAFGVLWAGASWALVLQNDVYPEMRTGLTPSLHVWHRTLHSVGCFPYPGGMMVALLTGFCPLCMKSQSWLWCFLFQLSVCISVGL